MAPTTTESTAAFIVGPPWWGEPWLTRDGGILPLHDPDLRTQRKAEAEGEVGGLLAALDTLPAECVLVLGGDNGATSVAHRWAMRCRRQTLVAPDVDPGSAWPVALAAAVGLQAAGWKVKALVCAAPGHAGPVGELTAARVFVRTVEPLVPVPEDPAE